MFILDSDTLTLLFAGHEKVVARREAVPYRWVQLRHSVETKQNPSDC